MIPNQRVKQTAKVIGAADDMSLNLKGVLKILEQKRVPPIAE